MSDVSQENIEYDVDDKDLDLDSPLTSTKGRVSE